MKKKICIFIALTTILNLTFAYEIDYSKGPFYGKDMFLPYLIYLNFPGVRAKTENTPNLKFHTSVYFINDFYAPYIDKTKTVYDKDSNSFIYQRVRAYDYESLSFENGVSFSFLKKIELGLNFRLIGHYGGFLDNIIETFHSIFGFPNAGREYFSQNDLFVEINNDSGVVLTLKNQAFSFGDIDVWGKFTFFQKRRLALAVISAFKIPTGNVKSISGSGYPDFGFGFLADFMPIRFISIYTQTFFILPFDSILLFSSSKPYPMFQGILNFSINPVKFFSISAQLNFKTPVLKTKEKVKNFYGVDQLSYPQLNILAGFIVQFKDFSFQFYFEENPVYTSGVDIGFNFLLSYRLKIII